MAEIQDLETEVSEIDAVTEQVEQTKQEQSAEGVEEKTQQKPEDEIPEKYRGKSLKELVDELDKTKHNMGKYANEAGELRRLADELIKSQLVPQKQEDKLREVDFFENPQEAVRRAVETNPEVQAAKQYAVAARQAQARAEFEKRHPDFNQVLQEQQFGEWIQKSKVRSDLWQRAVNFDVDAADELFGTYKELKSAQAVKQQATHTAALEVSKTARRDAMQSGSVQMGGTSEVGKKIYTQAFILNKLIHDKKWVEENRDEIDAAYAENRVKGSRKT